MRITQRVVIEVKVVSLELLRLLLHPLYSGPRLSEEHARGIKEAHTLFVPLVEASSGSEILSKEGCHVIRDGWRSGDFRMLGLVLSRGQPSRLRDLLG